jgi:outer membrane receptor protein involved in Fe transport
MAVVNAERGACVRQRTLGRIGVAVSYEAQRQLARAISVVLVVGFATAALADDAPPPYQSVVTATRTAARLAEVPATVTVIDREQLDATPDKLIDEALRDVPSFGAFRRSSSAVADPTSQGLNLRGVGPSGVSRGLVLVDATPETDAFGGWVYWRSLPTLAIERIEIVPGSGSALYGNYALSGIVQVITRAPTTSAVDVDAEAGSEDTARVAARVAQHWRLIGASVDGEYFRSDGYQVIAPYSRGAVDHPAGSDHATVNGRVEVYAAPRLRLFATGGYFREQQDGGTDYSTATVQLGRYAVGLSWSPVRVGRFDAAVFGHVEQFDQQRSRVDAMRATAALASQQRNPTTDVGDSIVFTSRPLHVAGVHMLTVGHDFRWIDSTPHELITPATVKPTSVLGRDVAARQLAAGFFAQDFVALGRYVDGALAVRADYWSNRDARTVRQIADGTSAATMLPDRDGWEWTPRLGLVARPVPWLALRAAASRSFRAPTINELYRPFQVGTIVTDPNAGLEPETLWGGELGVDATLRRLDVRATGFANVLIDPISNVTLPLPLADGAQRQRQNLGSAEILGLEVAASWTPARRWRVQAAYTFVDATVRSAPAQPQLVGKQLAQDPRHRFATSVMFSERRWFDATIELRYTSDQFDDDVNQLRLPGFVVVNAQLARRLAPHVDAFVAVENLLNQRYLVGRSGVDTVGEPLFAYAGIRYRASR